jgi:hypothetical protein
MSLSWFSNRSLKVSPKARLVPDEETDALRRKLAALDWQPENGFLKDHPVVKAEATKATKVRPAA